MLTSQLITKGDIKGIVDTIDKESVNAEKADLKIVWKSAPIPNGPIAVQSKLPQSLQAEIKRILLTQISIESFIKRGICASKDKCSIGDEDASTYTPVEDNLYDGVRKVCELTKSAKCKLT